MMDGISATTSVNSGSLSGSLTGGTNVNKDQFLELLVTQLQNQDPLEPVKNEDFLAQLATFSQLEEQQATHDTLKNMVSLQTAALSMSSLSQGAAIIGKEVEFVPDGVGDETRTGLVSGILFEPGGVMVQIGDEKIPLGNVVAIRSAEPAAPAAADPGVTADPTAGDAPTGNEVPPTTPLADEEPPAAE